MNMVLDNYAETFVQIQRKKKTFITTGLCPGLNQSEEEVSPSQTDERGEGRSLASSATGPVPVQWGGGGRDTSDDP